MEKVYAQALRDLGSREGAKGAALAEKLVAHLKATGRIKLLPHILRELRRLEQRSLKKAVRVEVAHQSEAAEALTRAHTYGVVATKAHVNHDLIRGWRAQGDSVLIDHSAKQGLIDLYRKVTAR
jgi:F0F1-type ATP synthase delta subunit